MALAFDAVTDFDGGVGTTHSTTHTCTGTNRFVLVAYRLGGTDAGATAMTGVTYGGVAMTEVESAMSISSTENLSLWYLVNPATGSQTVTGSCAASQTGNLKVTSYTGVKQTSPLDASVRVAGTTATSITLTMTTVADNCWLGGTVRSGNALTAGSNTIIRTGAVYVSIDSNSAQTPAGSKSMNLTQSSGLIGGIAMSFAPVLVVNTTSPSVLLLGV